jgi:hypothetical protein
MNVVTPEKNEPQILIVCKKLIFCSGFVSRNERTRRQNFGAKIVRFFVAKTRKIPVRHQRGARPQPDERLRLRRSCSVQR